MLILVMLLILALAILILVGVSAPPMPQTARYAVLFMTGAVFVVTLLAMMGVFPALAR